MSQVKSGHSTVLSSVGLQRRHKWAVHCLHTLSEKKTLQEHLCFCHELHVNFTRAFNQLNLNIYIHYFSVIFIQNNHILGVNSIFQNDI